MRVLNMAVVALSLLLTAPAMAGPRADHWSGFDLGVGGTPFPSLAGLALGFNIEDAVRLSAGIGTFVHYTSYELFDAKLFLSESQWAPYFGLGVSYLAGEHGNVLGYDLQFDKAFVPYFELGVDFQSDLGIHVGFNLGASAPNGRAIILPGIAIGWYF